ncbi:MAG: glutamine synthetase family protein [Dongiaceae bacterium]
MYREELVMFCYSDIAAQVRGKGFPLKDLEARMVKGIGWTPTNFAISAFGPIANSPFGPFGDLILMPDPATKARVDFGDDTPVEHFYLCDVLNTDCTPWDCCPRTFLKRALESLETETGLRILAALEQEFVYSGAEPNAASGYNLGSIRRQGEFSGAFLHALNAAGVDVDSYLPEFGARQYEVTYRATDAVRAADCALIVREIARATAHRLGHKASFAPMVAADGIGNGVHIHMSLWDRTGRPVTYDAARPYGLSAAAGQFVAGVIRHMPALCALTAPSLISYLRLTPHRWSAAYNNLGYRDREAGVRIAPVFETPGANAAEQYNFEYRAADASANPYLALAVLVHAGLDGIRQNLPVPQVTEFDPTTITPKQLQDQGIVRLPQSLAEALDALEADDVVRGCFPPRLYDLLSRYKRWELEFIGKLPWEEQCARYFESY